MKAKYAIGLEIGGTHITAGVIDIMNMKVLEFSMHKASFNSNLPVDQVLDIWEKAIRISWNNSGVKSLGGITVCMPGPFDYENGICWIKGQSKYDHFYGLNIADLLRKKLNLSDDFKILFENDAVCFGKGEVYKDKNNLSKKVMAITLGTGLGSCFIDKGISVSSGNQVPTDGEIWNLPFKNGIAEDYVSLRGLIAKYSIFNETTVESGLELYNLAVAGDEMAVKAFEKMGEDLAEILIPWFKNFSVEHFVIGGKIADSSTLFLPAFNKKIKDAGLEITIQISDDNENAALLGAASLLYNIILETTLIG
ncbi:ROK family protein [Flavobacterium aquariorum]|uniref:ROK family protein n=1 Tax=Flavobacterium aquariorum TaxID=2217670 RepID=A0A2W7UI85_9FLAO|nr:ROK family protein [Flavobacterium aquariorum]PZX94897.1 ROK family protein [Flavobacterium aquariorum]